MVCEGLDTLAQVFFNAAPLGSTENMFRRYAWEVRTLLREGENEVRVLLHGPSAYIHEKQAEKPLIGPTHSIAGAPYIRKAPCQFGWDWGPKLPPVGIWKEVRLEGYSSARFDDVYLRQQHADGKVTVSVELGVERWQDVALRAVLTLTAPTGETQTVEVPVAGDAATLALDVENPQLWWPNGSRGPKAPWPGDGAQPLYDVAVTLSEGDVLRDQRTFQLGLRTLELRQEPDDFGTSFTFVVNGVPIFAKGANWIPADSFPSRITDAHLEQLIHSAAEAHMNMLRVWGGGFYEEERFYNLCDRYGLLIWQDFVFSCSIYPMARYWKRERQR